MASACGHGGSVKHAVPVDVLALDACSPKNAPEKLGRFRAGRMSTWMLPESVATNAILYLSALTIGDVGGGFAAQDHIRARSDRSFARLRDQHALEASREVGHHRLKVHCHVQCRLVDRRVFEAGRDGP